MTDELDMYQMYNVLKQQNESVQEYGIPFEVYETIPTLDDVLDKISENGTKYLTEQELQVLKKYSEDEDDDNNE